tara:strand:- start:26499 stop:27755 length:1257 start_codon:yes stop_codon:yes gene_type:complete
MPIERETTPRPAILALLCLTAFGCSSAVAESTVAPQQAATQNFSAAELRAQGPEGLEVALRAYDKLQSGSEKEEQARLVDAVAGQRYATNSRLYWYTDFERAKEAAKSSGTPILSLRMLGRLDEDFSCANSRLFRTVLYPNEQVSKYLRKNFTLHWSSERAVPKLTVDFGDGRVLKGTIAGNSAHYVLSSDGMPVDVVPGLYSPKAFIKALEPSRRLAKNLGSGKDAIERVRKFHVAMDQKSAKAFAALPSKQNKALAPYRQRFVGKDLMAAEMLTMSKMVIEVPIARGLAAKAPTLDAKAVREAVTTSEPLDQRSRNLIVAMGPTDWGTEPAALQGAPLTAMLAELEQRVAADTLINRHGLHSLIHKLFIQDAGRDFETLNKLVYSDIFVTPADDPWLGMGVERGFTGLPGDGLAVH